MNGRCQCGKWGWLNKNGLCASCRPQPVKGPRTNKKVAENLSKKAKTIKRKITGELSVFREIWDERPRVCEVTGTPIKEFSVWCFAHLINKNRYSRYRLRKDNISLVQPWVHTIIDTGDTSKLEKYEGFLRLVEKRERLKSEYYVDGKVSKT